MTIAKRKSAGARPDFVVSGGGSVCTLQPITRRAQDWLDEHVASESWQWLGQGLVVEHRYIADIVAGAQADGFIVR